MTISTSNGSPDVSLRADEALAADVAPPLIAPAAPAAPPSATSEAAPSPTLWSRLLILLICTAIVTTTLAFGTVHSWALGLFQAGAALVVVFWMLDAQRSHTLRLSRNTLQLPLLGLMAVGLIQLLPLGGGDLASALPVETPRALSLDPNATRGVLVQLVSLTIFFAAALAFIDTPARLKLLVRTVIIFGFLLALFGLIQHFINPATIYFLREPDQAAPFGPYVNRHHFAGYMELTLALPLGLLFAGAVERQRALLYAFAAAVMAVALVTTNSRGGIISMAAQILFLVLVFPVARRSKGEDRSQGRGARIKSAALRLGLGFALVFGLLLGSLYLGGEQSLARLVGTVNAADPTTGRAHFWRGAIEIFKENPIIGVGLGGFSAAYTRHDTGNGLYRLEQAHNDYLQLLTDAGLMGGLLGIVFVAVLFRQAFARMRSPDRFRRGVALGALAGCAGVLVHSFFDFTLHSTANALMFLVLAALATLNGRVEKAETQRRRKRRRRTGSAESKSAAGVTEESRRAAA